METSQTEEVKYQVEMTPDELLGCYKATQVVLLQIAARLGMLEELEREIEKTRLEVLQRGVVGLGSDGQVLTRKTAPQFIQGVDYAFQDVLAVIKASKEERESRRLAAVEVKRKWPVPFGPR